MKVFIIAALSVDGFIGTDEHHKSTTWTTKADIQFFVRKTKEAGTVVMGRKTFDTFGKPLKDRRLIVLTSKPSGITLDGVEGSSESPVELVARLKNEGVQAVAICGGTSVYTQFLQAGVVDELYISVMPKIFGKGVPLFAAESDKNLALLDTEQLDDNTVMLHYSVL
jgi:dihydrofolate reductase